MNAVKVGRPKAVKKNPCPDCHGEGAEWTMHLGRGIWAGRLCMTCLGTGKRKVSGLGATHG